LLFFTAMIVEFVRHVTEAENGKWKVNAFSAKFSIFLCKFCSLYISDLTIGLAELAYLTKMA